MISKNFHHVLRMSDRMTLVGPPESMREHVVAASKSMKVGDWKACKEFLINEKMNTKVCIKLKSFYMRNLILEMFHKIVTHIEPYLNEYADCITCMNVLRGGIKV